VRVTFVMEQHLGHYTYYSNLRRFIDLSPAIEASWAPITYAEPGGIWERLPLLPAHLRGTLRGRKQVREALAHIVSDLVFFNTQVPAALGGKLIRRRPYMIATDLTPIQYDQLAQGYGHQADRPGLLKAAKQRINTRVLREAACLVPWSTWTRDSLIADYGVDANKIKVLPPGVDVTQWKAVQRPVDKARPLRILFVGGDLYRKGGAVLMRAFRSLPRGSAELSLVTRTTTPPEEYVVAYNNLQPNSPELIALFERCDVFVLPTEAEAFGIAAVEASAAGLPVIATAVGGLTDIVIDGETGFLLRPGDAEALARRLQTLAADPALRQRMSLAARERVETHFIAQLNAERMIQYMQTIIAAQLPHLQPASSR
jgi:glycosyltransferase involved in cell wall biosynthesis